MGGSRDTFFGRIKLRDKTFSLGRDDASSRIAKGNFSITQVQTIRWWACSATVGSPGIQFVSWIHVCVLWPFSGPSAMWGWAAHSSSAWPKGQRADMRLLCLQTDESFFAFQSWAGILPWLACVWQSKAHTASVWSLAGDWKQQHQAKSAHHGDSDMCWQLLTQIISYLCLKLLGRHTWWSCWWSNCNPFVVSGFVAAADVSPVRR